MRPGLRSNPAPIENDCASQSYPSLESEEDYGPPSNRRGQNFGAKQGGHTGSHGRRKRTRINTPANTEAIKNTDEAIKNTEIKTAEVDPTIQLESGELVVLPNLINFHELGVQWGPSRANQVLSSLSLPKNNRPSANGLFEAQALQSAYQLDKTMLCIVLKCSRHVLDEALLEGPLAREPNAYTNYQTYSVPAATTQMPAKGVSDGFGVCKGIVGHTWSTYQEDEQKVFSPELFDEAYALSQTPRGIPSLASHDVSEVPPVQATKSNCKPLSEEELTMYIPTFKRLVNLEKVSGDLHEGRLWRHRGKSSTRTREQLMKHEITKVVRQLHVLKNQLNIQFHLLLACWNPTTSANQALFQEEHSSCERWVRLQKKGHLLECFAFEATKAPENLRGQERQRKTKAQSAAGACQAQKRTPFLRGGVPGQSDAHPKVPNLKEGFARKTFRGKVKLTFCQTPDSLVNDAMLAKGPSGLSNKEVQLWLDDIYSKQYTIINIEADGKNQGCHTSATAALDEDEVPLPEQETPVQLSEEESK
ncbi:hypothetical protein DFH28DRAFT_939441 [Melampsora americana]|nr:hypothetical protein DFH28DRAFT_939441 [Melampsora americana]